jgi:hypothetical protein
MRSPALAMAWEFRRRYLWALIAMAGYLVVLAAVKLLFLGPMEPITLDPPDGRAAVVITPLTATFFYFLAAFSFGFAGDLAGRQSIYPARMLALPVRTEALVGWPMLYGTAAVAILWLVTALSARWPWEIALPLVWPALLAAAFLAWTQALMWMPYGLPGLRAIVTVLWLAALDAVVLLAIHYRVRETVIVAFLAPQIPLAYLTACAAVARARRGDVPDWRGMFARPASSAVPTHRRDTFASPARAQAWFEWRRQGWSLPAWVAILLPFELALLWLARDAPGLVLEILLVVFCTPPLLAMFASATVSQSSPHARDASGVAPFIGTRPLPSAALITAKLEMAAWSTLAAWVPVLVAVPLALKWSGTWPMVAARAIRTVELFGAPRAFVLLLLALLALMAATWKQLVQGLYVSLTGRAWVIRSSAFLALTFLIVIGPVAEWIHDDKAVQAALWSAVPAILAVLAGLKMCAAAWVAVRLAGSGLLSDRTLVTGAACWCAAVLALYGVLVWFFSTPFVARYVLALIAILAVPLARLSAVPLAFAWNRHR